MDILIIARVCHEANRAICEAAGDLSQKPWADAEDWQRESAVKGVQFALDNPNARAWAQHAAWLADKVAAGWRYGEVKDTEAKTHPCMVPYDDLPFEQRVKDHVFRAIVAVLKKLNGLSSIDIANTCHEAARALREAAGDDSIEPLDALDPSLAQIVGFHSAVEWALRNPTASVSAEHEAWLEAQTNQAVLACGLRYGSIDDTSCVADELMVPFDQLPFRWRAEHHLCRAIITAMKDLQA